MKMEDLLVPITTKTMRTFYKGSGKLAHYLSSTVKSHESEAWLSSIVQPFSGSPDMLSRLLTGQLLRDVLKDRGLVPLVKLLDTGDRIPVHAHPDDEFARETLGLARGKTEAWLILEAPTDGFVYVGWDRPISREWLIDTILRQDAVAMVSSMNRLSVRPGDCVLVPAGVVHTIGAGMLICEIQQPCDASLLLEHLGYTAGTNADSYLNRDLNDVLSLVELSAWGESELERYVERGALQRGGFILPRRAQEVFGLVKCQGGSRVDNDVPAIGFVLSGSGSVIGMGKELSLDVGACFAAIVPGELTFNGDVVVLIATLHSEE